MAAGAAARLRRRRSICRNEDAARRMRRLLISIGLGPVINWLVVGPAILIALGIVILLRALTGRR